MSYSHGASVDYDSQVSGVQIFEESVSSDEDFNHELVYTNKHNLVMGMNDEIIASNNFVDTNENSSIASYVISPRRTNLGKSQSREIQAEKYLKRLEKVKTKVVKKKLNLEDYNNQLKTGQGYVKIGQDLNFEEETNSYKGNHFSIKFYSWKGESS